MTDHNKFKFIIIIQTMVSRLQRVPQNIFGERKSGNVQNSANGRPVFGCVVNADLESELNRDSILIFAMSPDSAVASPYHSRFCCFLKIFA